MKFKCFLQLVLMCLGPLLSPSLWAQQSGRSVPVAGLKGTIAGLVADSVSGKPIAYATVTLLPSGSTEAAASTLTAEGGGFSFSNVRAGDYTIVVSMMGFQIKTISSVSITDRQTLVRLGRVLLRPTATQLKEVTIETLRPTITMEADKMVVNVEGTAMAAGSNAFEVLAKTPGVLIDQEGNIQLNGRTGVTVMLDGKMTYLSARELRTMFEGMPGANIKNIEVITNPSARFDAEGSSGILNINLRKNDIRGLNGSVYAGHTYNGKQHGFTTGATVNHKSNRWNSFLNLDLARRVGGREATFTRIFYGPNSSTYFDQEATGNYVVQGPPAIRLGTDYSLNKKHSLGYMAYFVTNNLRSDFLTQTFLGPGPNQPTQFIDAKNYSANRFSNFTSNLHYLGKLDTLGSTLSADLDLVKIRNQGDSYFYNYFTDLTVSAPAATDFLYTDTPNGFDIFSAKVDYTRPLHKGYKMEMGAKASQVVSDNDSRFYFNNTEIPVLDLRRTNHFVYDEQIYAAYLNLNGKLSARYKVQAGLRAEQTRSRGESLTTGQKTPRNYLNFFPSLFLQQQVHPDYQVSYSYSRRLQRPNYGNLNPFIAYRDPNTYIQGNPYLRPQFTQAFGFTQTYKKIYSLVLSYNRSEDVISELPILDVENATTIYTTGNVDQGRSLSGTLVAPLKIMKHWDTNNTLVVSYNAYRTAVGQEQILNDQLFYMLQTNHTILLPHKLRMEINAVYRGPAASGLYQIAPMGWVHLGLKKNFLDDKLEVSLNANDLFKTYWLRFATDIGGNVNDFDQYFRNRTIGLTLRYHFSKGAKFEAQPRNRSFEELNRTGG